MIYLLYTLEVIVCIFLILVVLLQQGSGADLSVFGGGSTQTAFGARGATQLIHKLTVWSFVAFIVLTLAIAVLKGGANNASVMTGIDTTAMELRKAAKNPEQAQQKAATPNASPTTKMMLQHEQPAEAKPAPQPPQNVPLSGAPTTSNPAPNAAQNPPAPNAPAAKPPAPQAP